LQRILLYFVLTRLKIKESFYASCDLKRKIFTSKFFFFSSKYKTSELYFFSHSQMLKNKTKNQNLSNQTTKNKNWIPIPV
jgi:hypothetical protein